MSLNNVISFPSLKTIKKNVIQMKSIFGVKERKLYNDVVKNVEPDAIPMRDFQFRLGNKTLTRSSMFCNNIHFLATKVDENTYFISWKSNESEEFTGSMGFNETSYTAYDVRTAISEGYWILL